MAVTPFRKALTEGMGGDNVFPFQPVSPFTIFLWAIIVARQDLFLSGEWATTIEGCLVVIIDLSQEDLFGFAEGLDGCVAMVSCVKGAGE